MRLAELLGARVVDGCGKLLGRVEEVHSDGGEVTDLGIGPATLLHRLTGTGGGRRIPWSAVTAIRKRIVIVEGD